MLLEPTVRVCCTWRRRQERERREDGEYEFRQPQYYSINSDFQGREWSILEHQDEVFIPLTRFMGSSGERVHRVWY